MKEQSIGKTILLVMAILAVAVLITVLLIKNKKSPPKSPPTERGALVEIFETAAHDYPLTIKASGTVAARRQISLEPQVSGKIVALGKGFASGAFFTKGEMLVQIEPHDYRLAVDQSEAALARAEVELATTQSQAAIARLEWERLGLQQQGEEANPLTLYEPQMKNARANIASAQAALELARLNLKRTTLRAPFNARIRSEEVDIGQFVRSGSRLATLSGTEAVEIIVSVPLEDLGWLKVPAAQRGSGSEATVSFRYGADEARWSGKIDRALGEVDPRGRMLQLAVIVRDPYRLRDSDSQGPKLEVGMFVDVQLAGPVLKETIVLPRRALRDNRTVWVADSDNLLRIKPVEIVRLEREQVVVGEGLEPGERVVLTTLTGTADGMQLRIADKGATP